MSSGRSLSTSKSKMCTPFPPSHLYTTRVPTGRSFSVKILNLGPDREEGRGRRKRGRGVEIYRKGETKEHRFSVQEELSQGGRSFDEVTTIHLL